MLVSIWNAYYDRCKDPYRDEVRCEIGSNLNLLKPNGLIYHGEDSWKNGFYCYDKETEILTDKGWKYFKDLDKTEKIATLNLKTNLVEYYKPFKYIKNYFKGELIYEKTKRMNLLVTPNHRMLIKIGHHRNLKNYFFTEARNLEKYKEVLYKRDFPFQGHYKKYFILPEIISKQNCWTINKKYHLKNIVIPAKKILMNDWLEFLGWFLSEGWCGCNGHNYRIVISQSHKQNPEKCKNIEDNLKRCGFKYYKLYTKDCINYTISNKQLYSYLKVLGKAKEKFIPREFLNLSTKQSRILLDTLIKGDGSIKKKTNYKVYNTSSLRLANDVSELALKIGYVPYLFSRKSGFINSLGYVIHLNRTSTSLVKNYRREKIPYNDYVYCVEVPNHLIYVRRKGQSCWSGNSSQLVSLFAINFALRCGFNELFLLGLDGQAIDGHTHFYDDIPDLGTYFWNGQPHSGIGKDSRGYYRTSNYNKPKELNAQYKPFENESNKIINVSPDSVIETFLKVDYDEFLAMLDYNPQKINQEEIRKEIKELINAKNFK
jgi:hypothetical protein